jgi:hypothetical protein
MNALVNKLSRTSDFVWDAAMEYLPSEVNRSRTNFINFDCPMCVTVGETPDTKKRCGISKTFDTNGEGVLVSCFNCGFKASYQASYGLTIKFRDFLSRLGMPELEVNRLNIRASQLARVLGDSGTVSFQNPNKFQPHFSKVDLPSDCHPILTWGDHGLDDPDFLEAAAYAMNRGDEVLKRAYWSPEDKWKHRLIFPCRWRGEVVGWTGRLVKKIEDEPKYLNEVPANYLSNCDTMNNPKRKFILLPEGYLDAESIDGVSPFGAKLNKNQVTWLKETGKTIIVIPDRDKSGERLIDIAIANEWMVAFPRLTRAGNNWWEEDCKDCAEAVKRYGRLYTLRSIIATATNRRLEIEIRRKWLY